MSEILNRSENPHILKATQISLLAKEGVLSEEALGLTNKEAEKIYSHGKKLYDSGKYKDALAVFSILTLMNPNMPAYLYGLASSCYMLKNLEEAIEAFLEYAAIVPEDPMPYYYVSNCYEKKNDLFSAMVTLQAAINRAGNKDKFQELKNRAILILDYLKKLNLERLTEKAVI